MNIQRITKGQPVLVEMRTWDIDGIPVEYNLQTRVRNHAPGNKVFVHKHKPAVKAKRISII